MRVQSLRMEELRPVAWVWFRRIAPPVFVFALARLRLWRSAIFAGADPSDPHAWGRWDSGHYYSIATRGYELFSCAQVPGYDPTQHCGNAAWLPGYPLLVRALMGLHIGQDVAGTLIAAAFALGTLIVIWNCFLEAELSVAALATLGLAAFFPGHVYYHAAFPVSMCTFFLVSGLAAYTRRQFLLAGLAGACAAFSYSSGAFVAAVFGLHLLVVERHVPFRQQVRQWILTSGVTALGFAAFLLLLQLTVGTWEAYFLVQAKYNYDPTWPWMAVFHHALEARLSGSKFTNVQTTFVAVMSLLLLAAAVRKRREAADGLFALFLLVYWWVPLALGGSLSLYRAESMLIGAVPLARKLPLPVLLVLLAIAFVIASRMGVLFFKNALV